MCWSCGTIIKTEINQTVGRTAVCNSCGKYLHVCKNCRFYDVLSSNQCKESNAELVSDKENSNFCDYFKISDFQSFSKDEDFEKKAEAKDAFNALFG